MQLAKEHIEQILSLARQGKSVSEIQSATGSHYPTIHSHCRRAGIDVQKRSARAWPRRKVDELVRRYKSGQSWNEIMTSMGCTDKVLTKYLHQEGVQKRGRALRGSKNPAWKGGVIYDKKGYALVHSPGHPHRTKNNRVRRHRLVMEQVLGRYLEPHEVVDHINGIPGDDRPENLRVFASNAEHLRATLKGRIPKWSEAGRARLDDASRRGIEAAHKKIRSTRDAHQ
jgi:hypothetical protein